MRTRTLRHRRIEHLCFFPIVLAYLLTITGNAQSIAGVILGTVTDPSGHVVAGAQVDLLNRGTNAHRTAKTMDNGDFRFEQIEPGTYLLTVDAAGFQRQEFSPFVLMARETRRLDSSLKLLAQSETVNVESSDNAVLQADTSSIVESETGRELVDLPVAIASRASGSTSPLSTLTTQPGVVVDSAGQISVAGTIPSQLSVSIDGISVTGPIAGINGPIAELFPSFSAIEEIRVGEVVNPAEYGGVADIATVSKSGSNDYHGGAFENFQNNALNASNSFTHTTPTVKMNNFGIFLGGPVFIPTLYNGRDRTFFFGDFEALRLPMQTIQIENVPTLAMRSGDLTALGGPVVPSSSISALSLKMLQYLYPLPNIGSSSLPVNNYAGYFSTPTNSNQGDLRLDQVISSAQRIFVRGTYKNRRVETAPPGSPLQGSTQQPEVDYSFAAGHSYVITSSLINELRGGVSGRHASKNYGIPGTTIASQLGLTGFQVPTVGAVPWIDISGLQSTSVSAASRIFRDRSIQFLDALTWSKKTHTIKSGIDYRYLSGKLTNVDGAWRLGRYIFNGSVTSTYTSYFPHGLTSYQPYEAFLRGIPDSTGTVTTTQPDTEPYASQYAFFVQDDWKVSSRFTLNFGLRYEYHPMFQDHLLNISTFLPDYYSVVGGVAVHGAVVVPNARSLALTNVNFAKSIYPTPILTASEVGLPGGLRSAQGTDFLPRIGFAWRLFSDGKTVIRGGYGRFIEALTDGLGDTGYGVHTSNLVQFSNPSNNATNPASPVYTFPYPFPSDLAQPGSQSFRGAFQARQFPDPLIQEWDLTVERDLGKGVALRVSYDGTHGSNLNVNVNANQLPLNTSGYTALRSLAPFPLWQYIVYERPIGTSNYNALTTSVRKRLSAGLQFQASYVYAKNLSDNAGYNPTAFSGELGGTISNPLDPRYDYGNVVFTPRHRFLATFLYELPLGRDKTFLGGSGAVLNRVIGDWQVAGVVVDQSGPWMSILSGGDPSGTGFPILVGNGRADRAQGVSPYASQSLHSWINPSAFVTPQSNIGRFGNSAVGTVTGPGTNTVSLSLFKSVALAEALKLQIGVSATNTFNHPNYAIPSNLTVGTSGFAQISNVQSTQGAGPRALQLSGRITF